MFDGKLTWKPHVDDISNRAPKRIRAFKRLAGARWDCSTQTYHTFFLPLLIYCCKPLVAGKNLLNTLEKNLNSVLMTFYVVAPNTLRLDSDETIAIALEGKPVALVHAYIQDYPGKIKNLTQIVSDVKSDAVDIFNVHVRSEDLPPNFLSTPGEKSVLLTVHSDNFHKEIPIPVSNKTGYVFIQTDKPIYTPNQLVHIRVIPLNEDALPSNRPIKLQIKNPNGTTVEETLFNKGKTSKFQTAFARHMYKFPNFPIMGEWTATVNYGYGLEQSTTVHFELQEYVLPTFTVELKTPEIILESDKDIVLTVNA
ncbi:complement C3, partial [Trichonephila clavata]